MGLNRELNRMQNIDRIKVAHASSNFFNPDTGALLPSLDSCYANSGHSTSAFVTQHHQHITPLADIHSPSPTKDFTSSLLHTSMISDKDIVTQNELRGLCERFGA